MCTRKHAEQITRLKSKFLVKFVIQVNKVTRMPKEKEDVKVRSVSVPTLEKNLAFLLHGTCPALPCVMASCGPALVI